MLTEPNSVVYRLKIDAQEKNQSKHSKDCVERKLVHGGESDRRVIVG